MLKNEIYKFDDRVGLYVGQDLDTGFLIFENVVDIADIAGSADIWKRYPAEHLTIMKDWEQNGRIPKKFLKHKQLLVNPKCIKEIAPMNDYFTEREN